MAQPNAPLLVGVHPGQDPAVLERAAQLALRLNSRLLCAWADPARYTIERRGDGSVRTAPLDPDSTASPDAVFPAALQADLQRRLEPSGLDWGTAALAGSPGRELAALAQALGARMIIVGARAPSLRTSMHELLNGSTAAYLLHRQWCPVLVVPASPAR